MLMRNKSEQEVVSRDKRDRRDFEQLSALAIRMGLHRYMKFCQTYVILLYFCALVYDISICSGRYEKVVVFSKLPLPNYRSDLDEKRPQREVLS